MFILPLCHILLFSFSSVDITTTDPRWVGAWWVGFIVTAVLFFIFALPLSAYPRNIAGM